MGLATSLSRFRPGTLTGETSPTVRQKAIDAFQIACRFELYQLGRTFQSPSPDGAGQGSPSRRLHIDAQLTQLPGKNSLNPAS